MHSEGLRYLGVVTESTDQKHIAVVGASKGLGASVVKYFAAKGWLVSFGARNSAVLEKMENELSTAGYRVNQFQIDVNSEASVEKFFSSARDTNGQIDAVVHLAATYKPFGSIRSVNASEWTNSIHTNLNGTFFVLKHALVQMEDQDKGDIVVLSGGGATAPMPTISAYAASKAAVVRLVETIALEESGRNIRINALAPGLMDTDMLDEVIAAGSDVVDESFLDRMKAAKSSGEDSRELATRCIEFLLTNEYADLTGLLISAKWDDWQSWQKDGVADFSEPTFRLRRIDRSPLN